MGKRFATYATNAYSHVGHPGEEAVPTTGFVDSNMQLRYWMEAKSTYFQKIYQTAATNLDDVIFVVNCLGNSLTALFGQNFKGNGSWTPSLLNYVDVKSQKSGFCLEKENLVLYKRLKAMNDVFCNFAKHIDQSKRVKLASLSKETIAEFMETTRRVWLWFGNHLYPDGIPKYLLTEFGDTFANF